MICGSRYDNRAKQVLGQGEVYKMWRIFNFFAEPGNYPVVLDPQVSQIISSLSENRVGGGGWMGKGRGWIISDWISLEAVGCSW